MRARVRVAANLEVGMGRIPGMMIAVMGLSGCVASGLDARSHLDVDVEAVDGPTAEAHEALSGAELFTSGTFGGNGRTCATCHSLETGTFSAADAKARFAADPSDPLFRPIDSDDGTGRSYKRLLREATVSVSIPLPANVRLVGSPDAKAVTFYRSTPTTIDTPALDPVLMWDGREASLEDQAADAILGHAGAPAKPGAKDIDKIVAFEQKQFSRKALKKYANGGPSPVLPAGNTASEKRGAKWFDATVPSGVCAHCHSGPMLNEAGPFNVFGFPVGTRFITAFVSELNPGNRPLQTFLFTNEDGSTTTVTTPDPGRALITGNATDVNFFKIPSLWSVKDTAPYFHDNSAKNLEEMVHHYKNFFQVFTNGGLILTPQDEADIVAFVKLL
jgi:cytochrome c peroxidase